MTIQTVAKYLWAEIHRGNLLVIAGLIATYFLVVVPIYSEIKDWLSGHDQVNAYIIQDMEKIKEEIANIKKSTHRELSDRKSGVMGTTRH